MVNTEFMQSVIDLEKPAGTSYSVIKNTMIYIARNIFAGNAIQAGFDRVFWMDSDMSFPPDALVKLSQVMDDTGADLVTGLYFTRKPPIKPVVYDSLWWKPHEKGIDAGAYNMWAYPDNDIAKIKSCGFGCCLTSVDLIKRIGDKFGSPFTPLDGLGEDMAFCLRANELGATMLVDTSVKCGHIGYMEYNEIYYRKQGKPNES